MISIDSTSNSPTGLFIGCGNDNPFNSSAILITKGHTGLGGSSTVDCVKIDFEGNANFIGTVTANNVTFNLEPDNPANYETTTEEYEDTIRVPIIGGIGTADLVDGEPERFEEKTVTRTREVTTYVGPTLDVKTELQALRERAAQQDAVIAQMTAALRELGKEVSAMPSVDEEPPEGTKTSRKRKR